jgi:hypothetical protein
MTTNGRRYINGTSGYRPGALNVQVNGIQIEDLYQEWAARTEECEKLRQVNKEMSDQLREQGKLIKELKEKIKENK